MLAVASVVQLFNLASPDLFSSPVTFAVGALQVASVFTLLGELLVAVGLIGLYVRRSEALGFLGLVAFVLFFVGLLLIRGNYLAVLAVDLGAALFGVASLRSGAYPRNASILLIVSALIRELFSPTVTVGPGSALGYVGAAAGIALHVAIIWLGFILLTGRGEEYLPPQRTSPNLLRLGGEAAVLGAALNILFEASQLVGLIIQGPGTEPGDPSEAVITSFYAVQLLALVGGALLALGLIALYTRQSEATPRMPATRLIALIGASVAFVGTFFSLDVEDVNWGALLAFDLGWALFAVAAFRAPAFPRIASMLLVIGALLSVLVNPLVITLVASAGGDTTSDALYEGPGAYTVVYVGEAIRIVFYMAVALMGLALIFGTRLPEGRTTRRPGEEAEDEERGGTFGRHSRFRMNLLYVAVLAVGLIPIALVAGIFPGEQPPGLQEAQAETTETSSACPSSNRAKGGVYHSSRLIPHDPCKHLGGTVHDVESSEADGDLDVYVTLDLDYQSLGGSPQNASNLRRFSFGGDLMTEFIPRDGQSVDPDDTSQLRPAHLPKPNPGDKVDMWGAWVFDTQHGYYEFHPVFSVSFSTDGGETWGETYTSGPRYGGSPQRTPSARRAYKTCGDENENQCVGYYDPTR